MWAVIAKRIARARSLSQTMIKLSRQAISRANPGLSEQELNIAFVAYHYGADMAERLKNSLEKNDVKTPDIFTVIQPVAGEYMFDICICKTYYLCIVVFQEYTKCKI